MSAAQSTNKPLKQIWFTLKYISQKSAARLSFVKYAYQLVLHNYVALK